MSRRGRGEKKEKQIYSDEVLLFFFQNKTILKSVVEREKETTGRNVENGPNELHRWRFQIICVSNL